MKPKIKYANLLQQIGNTPMIELELNTKATILAKLEYFNPGGSSKDRTALFLINQAEKKGLLKPGGTIIEASSGNQGSALAMIGALKGYKVIITVSESTSEEKKAILQAYGATVYVCPAVSSFDDPRGKHAKALQLHRQIPSSFMPNQYFNKNNSKAHYLSTGPEIWRQTKGNLTHCFIAMGTCGTISGVGRFLKKKNPKIKIIGVDAATSMLSSPNCPKPYKTEGLGVDLITEVLDRSVIDSIIPVNDKSAFKMARTLAHKGLLFGLSAGALMHAVLDYSITLKKTDTVVALIADSGRSYLSKLY